MPYKDKEKDKQYHSEYQKSRLPEINKRRKEKYASDPKFRLLRSIERHNITLEDYLNLLERQDNKCAICKEEFVTRIDWSNTDRYHPSSIQIDHDNNCCNRTKKFGKRVQGKTCGKCIRGLLCRTCNLLLGYAKDDIY